MVAPLTQKAADFMVNVVFRLDFGMEVDFPINQRGEAREAFKKFRFRAENLKEMASLESRLSTENVNKS